MLTGCISIINSKTIIMSSTSNQLGQRGRLLTNRPMNEVNAQGEVFKINGKTTFVMNYPRWLEIHNKLISEIRNAMNDQNHHIRDDKLRLLINIIMKHHFELFEIKTSAASVDVYNVDSAIWYRTVEHDLWWIGGFCPSELLEVILPQLQHLCTQQQLDIYNFRQSCQQAEDALTQGMEKLQQILDKATAAGDKGFQMKYVPQQVSFLKQADHLRQEFMHEFCRLLTIPQQAEFLVAFGEFLNIPQPLSSL